MPRQSDDRFWDSTRGRIVVLLRKENCTVNDLAKALKLTDNAVRAQLTALERDGLVQQSGTRRGTRKPNLTYALTPKAEQLFPKLYDSVLRQFLDVLKARTPANEIEAIVRAVGHRMALQYRPTEAAGQSLDHREKAADLLRLLGGFCESEARDEAIIFRCSDCPLAAVVVAHPEVCQLVETVLADVLGVPVKERCQMGKTPQCVFEITPTGA